METAKKITCGNCGTENDENIDKVVTNCKFCQMDICNLCGGGFKPIIENNGFNAPDPTHFETTGYKCTGCGLII